MTSTDICNMALSMIGQGRIHDLEEESEQARQCKVYYDHIRKTLLSNFTWGFAHRFKRLVKVEGTFPKWEYAYAYPENCLAVHMVYDQSEDQIKDDVYTEYDTASIDDGRKIILCDFPHAVCDYTANVTNADMFPTVFVTALAQFIAASLAIPLSGSATLANYYQQSGNLTLEEERYRAHGSGTIHQAGRVLILMQGFKEEIWPKRRYMRFSRPLQQAKYPRKFPPVWI